jgi:hypothetical protein
MDAELYKQCTKILEVVRYLEQQLKVLDGLLEKYGEK